MSHGRSYFASEKRHRSNVSYWVVVHCLHKTIWIISVKSSRSLVLPIIYCILFYLTNHICPFPSLFSATWFNAAIYIKKTSLNEACWLLRQTCKLSLVCIHYTSGGTVHWEFYFGDIHRYLESTNSASSFGLLLQTTTRRQGRMGRAVDFHMHAAWLYNRSGWPVPHARQKSSPVFFLHRLWKLWNTIT